MKTAFSLILAAGVSSAAVTFDSPPYGGDLTAIAGVTTGIDGWTQTEDNVDAFTGDPGSLNSDAPLFYVRDIGGGDYRGYINGFYAIPDATSFSASRDFENPLVNLGAGSILNFDTVIVDSIDFPERNNFGFVLTAGLTDLVKVLFQPESQTGFSNWAVYYSYSDASGQFSNFTQSSFAIVPSSQVDFTTTFSSGGIQVTGEAGGVSSGFFGSPVNYDPNFSGDLTVSFFWEEGLAANPGTGFLDYGDNGLLIDNIELIVPEPSSGILSILSLALMLRRRRV